MADPISITHSDSSVSGAAFLGAAWGVDVAQTFTGVRVQLPQGNLSGETQSFDLYINGVAQSVGLLVPDGDNEATVTGLSIAVTDDDSAQFRIESPVADSLPIPPYHFTIYRRFAVSPTNALTAKTTPVDADEFEIADSAASYAPKKLTWANLKATIKTYYDAVTSTLTNKTLTSSTNVLGGVTMTLGSDANGDTYYRASGVLTRLPKGTASQVLAMNGGATAPEWVTPSSGSVATDAIWDAKGDLAVGTGANTAAKLTVGTNGQILSADSGETTGLKWISAPGGGDALTSNPLSQFASTTSAQLRGVLSDETGTGVGVFNDTPTLIAPLLGTPTSGTLTNCTGLPVAGIAASTSTALGVGSVELGHASDTTIARVSAGVASIEGNNIVTANNLGTGVLTQLGLAANGSDVDAIGFRGIPQNAQTGNYTLVLADAGKHIFHASGDGSGDTYTIPANASVAFEVGTSVTFVNLDSNAVSIAITTDTMYLGGTGTTGTRSLAQYGVATAIKVTSTAWVISGAGLT